MPYFPLFEGLNFIRNTFALCCCLHYCSLYMASHGFFYMDFSFSFSMEDMYMQENPSFNLPYSYEGAGGSYHDRDSPSHRPRRGKVGVAAGGDTVSNFDHRHHFKSESLYDLAVELTAEIQIFSVHHIRKMFCAFTIFMRDSLRKLLRQTKMAESTT